VFQFKSERVVHIRIEDPNYDYDNPGKPPGKETIIQKLHSFLSDSQIFPAVRAGSSSHMHLIGFYTEEDALVIEQWLKDNGVKKV
jgi:hypothetical protein